MAVCHLLEIVNIRGEIVDIIGQFQMEWSMLRGFGADPVFTTRDVVPVGSTALEGGDDGASVGTAIAVGMALSAIAADLSASPVELAGQERSLGHH